MTLRIIVLSVCLLKHDMYASRRVRFHNVVRMPCSSAAAGSGSEKTSHEPMLV